MSHPPRIPLSVLITTLFLFTTVTYARGGDFESDEPVCKGGDEDVGNGCPLQGNGDFYGLGVRIGICTSRTELFAIYPSIHSRASCYFFSLLRADERTRFPMAHLLAGQQLPPVRDRGQSGHQLDLPARAVFYRVHVFPGDEAHPCHRRLDHPPALRRVFVQHHESLGLSDE